MLASTDAYPPFDAGDVHAIRVDDMNLVRCISVSSAPKRQATKSDMKPSPCRVTDVPPVKAPWVGHIREILGVLGPSSVAESKYWKNLGELARVSPSNTDRATTPLPAAWGGAMQIMVVFKTLLAFTSAAPNLHTGFCGNAASSDTTILHLEPPSTGPWLGISLRICRSRCSYCSPLVVKVTPLLLTSTLKYPTPLEA
jgi:hypothetical protein